MLLELEGKRAAALAAPTLLKSSRREIGLVIRLWRRALCPLGAAARGALH